MKYTSNPSRPAKRKVVWPAILVAVGIVGIIGWTVAKFQPSGEPVGVSRQISAGTATKSGQASTGTNADVSIDRTQLEAQLVEAQAELGRLSERYLERHPRVLAQQKVIDDLEDQLRNASH
jgi:hypothetical protein